MKILRLFVSIYCLLIPITNVAQTPTTIETDLLKSFKTIDYRSQDNGKANEIFAKKLKYYTEKYPFTINQDFTALKAAHLNISSSADSLFRIYSWDTWKGGTMHFFENIFQYKIGTKTISLLDTPKGDGDNRPNYRKLYTFKVNDHTYYLCDYITIGSSKDIGEGIQVFDIENGVLNNNVRIIKTKSGLHNKLSYEYDLGTVVDWKVRPSVNFDSQTKTIKIPVVVSNGKVTHNFIIYKFTGQYFERMKN
jgi:hypothetical protein